ncbi:hypothetical protein GALMADRAFT_68622 [Galerina marginata CBS 339.88]|uniref:ATP phosphoribosyltransferase n=1 Tax=Galerina marginata (strain CBS 339.88) TaxID=685588 RepID=A0A067T6N5_GALM3|nr:hypothetical protein GALMADRAFT_68622 [Galerina marginata CBS 339.88]
MSLSRFKLVFFAPKDSTRPILDHLFRTCSKELGNVGTAGNYEQCAFITRGTGQFLPKTGANPTIGTVGQLELVEEDRVEIVVNGEHTAVRKAIMELKNVHPYEEVAYDVYKLEVF